VLPSSLVVRISTPDLSPLPQLALTYDHGGRSCSCLMHGYVHEIIDGAPLIDPKTPADTTQRPDAPHTPAE
jgi:hypothetical protein